MDLKGILSFGTQILTYLSELGQITSTLGFFICKWDSNNNKINNNTFDSCDD